MHTSLSYYSLNLGTYLVLYTPRAINSKSRNNSREYYVIYVTWRVILQYYYKSRGEIGSHLGTDYHYLYLGM